MEQDMNKLPPIRLNDIESDVIEGQQDIEEILAILKSEQEEAE